MPELAALAEELALLAARAENAEQTSAVLDELARLGEDVERLIVLARADGRGPAGDEPSPLDAPALPDGLGSASELPAPAGGPGEEEPRA